MSSSSNADPTNVSKSNSVSVGEENTDVTQASDEHSGATVESKDSSSENTSQEPQRTQEILSKYDRIRKSFYEKIKGDDGFVTNNVVQASVYAVSAFIMPYMYVLPGSASDCSEHNPSDQEGKEPSSFRPGVYVLCCAENKPKKPRSSGYSMLGGKVNSADIMHKVNKEGSGLETPDRDIWDTAAREADEESWGILSQSSVRALIAQECANAQEEGRYAMAYCHYSKLLYSAFQVSADYASELFARYKKVMVYLDKKLDADTETSEVPEPDFEGFSVHSDSVKVLCWVHVEDMIVCDKASSQETFNDTSSERNTLKTDSHRNHSSSSSDNDAHAFVSDYKFSSDRDWSKAPVAAKWYSRSSGHMWMSNFALRDCRWTSIATSYNGPEKWNHHTSTLRHRAVAEVLTPIIERYNELCTSLTEPESNDERNGERKQVPFICGVPKLCIQNPRRNQRNGGYRGGRGRGRGGRGRGRGGRGRGRGGRRRGRGGHEGGDRQRDGGGCRGGRKSHGGNGREHGGNWRRRGGSGRDHGGSKRARGGNDGTVKKENRAGDKP